MTGLRRLLPSGNALFVFEATARRLSFSRAAAELNVTQPAVSRMIGRLEKHLDAKLFVRGPEGVALTDEGHILQAAIATGFRGVEGALEEIRRRRTGLDTVTLSLSSAFTTHWLMPRIGALQKACPVVDLRFQLISGALKGPVDTVDLGMRFLEPGDDASSSSFFVNEVVFPVCSPAYRDRGAGAATADTFINLADYDPGWIETFRRGAGRSSGHHDLLSFSDYAVVLQAALLGQGIALGWISVVSHWLKTGALIPAGPVMVRTKRRCCLLWPPARPLRPASAAVRDWLTAEMNGDLAAIDRLYPEREIGRLSL